MSLPPNTIAFDACVPLDHVAAGLGAAGFSAVGRYIAPGAANSWKVISMAEAVTLAIARIAVFPIYETSGDPNGSAEGEADGRFAASYLPSVGLAPNSGVVVYYAEDMDTAESEMDDVAAAFSGFGRALGAGYAVGSYGGGYCNAQLAQRGLIAKKWLTQSQGFNGTKQAIAAGDYDMIQRLPADLRIGRYGTVNVDPDSLRTPDIDIGARVPWDGKVPAGAPINVYALARLLTIIGRLPHHEAPTGAAVKVALREYMATRRHLDWDGTIPRLLADAGITIIA